MASSPVKIGFIGLGIMGKPMAKNLLKAGKSVVVYDVASEPVEEVVRAGAETAASPKDVAGGTDVIITMLPNSPHVREVLCGKDGLLVCAVHGASFELRHGQCVGGPCRGEALREIAVHCADGEVRLGTGPDPG